MTKYSSDPKKWGPYFWYVIKSMAHNYPNNPNVETIKHTKAFLYSLQSIMPCQTCKNNYKKYILEHPFESCLYDRNLLLHWIHKLENDIRKMKK